MTLAELGQMRSARILKVAGNDSIAMRALEMGMTPGVVVKRIGQAPLGDPIEFEVRGYRLSLRKAEAERVEIEAIS